MNFTTPRLRLILLWLATALLSACASPIVTQVSRFNQWPADTAGSSFAFIQPPASPAQPVQELEQATYEAYAQQELEKLGLRRATSAQTARLLVELNWISQPQQRSYVEPVYQDRLVFHPPYVNKTGRLFPGYWAPSHFGPTYVGDRVGGLHRLVQPAPAASA